LRTGPEQRAGHRDLGHIRRLRSVVSDHAESPLAGQRAQEVGPIAGEHE
jgi:hypothetical protein